MFAIIETGGKQYRVEEGQIIEVEKIEAGIGETVEITDVLAVGNDGDLKVGQPKLEGAKVEAKVISHKKGDKVIVFKKKAKTGYKKKRGHRQPITVLKIEKIVA
ncbi:MAG: 50S ribosomal protein L21 [Candidatus Aminicenantes bacterium]|nr:50S ribosomal protein L21 [Candidatus Aminicenantes bacterium]